MPLGGGNPLNRSDAELMAIAATSRHPEGYIRHKYDIFKAFVELLPQLSARYANRQIIIRPHPSEDHGAWRAAAAGLENVDVQFDADLVPWLLAAGALLHNGCTTAVEAAMLGRTAIMYRPIDGGRYEIPQPLAVSVEAKSEAAVFDAIDRRAADNMPELALQNLSAIVTHDDEELAAARIADQLVRLGGNPSMRSVRRFRGTLASQARARQQHWRRGRADSPSNPTYIGQKFPPIAADDIAQRLQRMAERLSLPMAIVEQYSDRVFLISEDR